MFAFKHKRVWLSGSPFKYSELAECRRDLGLAARGHQFCTGSRSPPPFFWEDDLLEPSQGVCVRVVKNKELRGQQSSDETHSSIHLTHMNHTQAPELCGECSDLSEARDHFGGIFLSPRLLAPVGELHG